MKILLVELENFGSYKHLKFDFESQGLSLIQGATGSGKSTLCDAAPWVLYGKTAKGGTVDEVLAWPGKGITKGKCVVKFHEYASVVVRTRGPSAKDNDLYISDQGQEIRGKDLHDTQKIINSMLGLDYELYLAGGYYHEFSATAGFFTATAKIRRQICEQLVDLSLAVNLQAKLKAEEKTTLPCLNSTETNITALKSKNDFLEQFEEIQNRKKEAWQRDHDESIEYTIKRHDEFEAKRKKTVSKSCKTCGTVLEKPKVVIDDTPNPHIYQLENLAAQKNPYLGGVKDCSVEIAKNKLEIKELTARLEKMNEKLSEISQLLEVTSTYRSVSINNTITYIETQTNELLMKHFDAEIQVKFQIEASDKLDVQIYKGENLASFTQLSKGQRQLLKLCFGLSVMQAVQNHHGVKFSQIFIDEATDGLDEHMKAKAFKLLETLTRIYDDVFLVEHSEALKSLFTNKYTVELVNGESQIAKT